MSMSALPFEVSIFESKNFRFVEIFLSVNVYGKRSGVRMARAYWLASSPQFLLDPDWKIKVKTATWTLELDQIKDRECCRK